MDYIAAAKNLDWLAVEWYGENGFRPNPEQARRCVENAEQMREMAKNPNLSYELPALRRP